MSDEVKDVYGLAESFKELPLPKQHSSASADIRTPTKSNMLFPEIANNFKD